MIVIPDRDMPKTCGECPCLHQNPPYYCKALKDKLWISPSPRNRRPKWCPLKEGRQA